MVKEVADMPEFHSKNVSETELNQFSQSYFINFFSFKDFEVNLIKFTTNVDIKTADGKSDYTFLARDCFHFSQKGHSK